MIKIQSLEVQKNQEVPKGRLLALDLGQKRVGVAVCDELQTVARPLPFIQKTNWKKFLLDVTEIIKTFDAQALVIGLPLNMDSSDSPATTEVRRIARNFSLSLEIPVFLQDERLTTVEAERSLSKRGFKQAEKKTALDGEAAAIVLQDFLSKNNFEPAALCQTGISDHNGN